MRFLPALLLLILAASPASAAVRIVGTFNGAPIPTCNNATGVRFALGDNTFRFTCSEDGISRVCAPTQAVSYTTGTTPTVNLTCDNGTEVGLIVEAVIDGVPNVCSVATSVFYTPLTRNFGWTCGAQANACFPITAVNYNISQRRITLACTTTNPFIFEHGFED